MNIDETTLKILIVTMIVVTVVNVIATQIAIYYLSDLFDRALTVSLKILKILIEDNPENKNKKKL